MAHSPRAHDVLQRRVLELEHELWAVRDRLGDANARSDRLAKALRDSWSFTKTLATVGHPRSAPRNSSHDGDHR